VVGQAGLSLLIRIWLVMVQRFSEVEGACMFIAMAARKDYGSAHISCILSCQIMAESASKSIFGSGTSGSGCVLGVGGSMQSAKFTAVGSLWPLLHNSVFGLAAIGQLGIIIIAVMTDDMQLKLLPRVHQCQFLMEGQGYCGCCEVAGAIGCGVVVMMGGGIHYCWVVNH